MFVALSCQKVPQRLNRTADVTAYYTGNRRALRSLPYVLVSNFHLFLPRTLHSSSFLIKSNLYKIHHVFVPKLSWHESCSNDVDCYFYTAAYILKTVIQIWNTFIHQLQPTVSSGNARLLRDDNGLWYFAILYQLCCIVNTVPPAVSSCWVIVITVTFKWHAFVLFLVLVLLSSFFCLFVCFFFTHGVCVIGHYAVESARK